MKSPFYISKKSRRGLTVLFFLAFFIVLIPRLYVHFLKVDTVLIKKPLIKVETKTNNSKSKENKKKYSKKKKKLVYRSPKGKFDPNEYTHEDWMYLGLSEKQTNVIMRFLNHKIYTNEALKKIYVLPDTVYHLIKDSTVYPAQIFDEKETFVNKKTPSITKFLELNTVDSIELISINGIGPFYASQIINYRNKLGGFYKREQLMEIWKMKEETYQILMESLIIDTSTLQKIHLNTVSFEKLKNHPYLSYSQANSIVKMRTQLGRFDSISSIKKSKLINDDTFLRVRPYLSLD
ncbi:MAG: helix-hairpin-helix domain-containing protein [Crocinitomicaceae bacterium]|nr:helix-hairpin-helix domain-containing protein [Crocinitomicaceae bacterium]